MNLPDSEIWESLGVYNDIDYSGYYEISNHGRVRNILYDPPKILSTTPRPEGYVTVSLNKRDDNPKTVRLHRLVATVFLPNDDPSKNQINHINKNRSDNHVSNLEWCTNQENAIHGYAFGDTKKTKRGKWVRKYDSSWNLITEYESILSAARDNDIPKQTLVEQCARNELIDGFYFVIEPDYDYPEDGVVVPGHPNYLATPRGEIYCISKSRYETYTYRDLKEKKVSKHYHVTMDGKRYSWPRIIARTFYGKPPCEKSFVLFRNKDTHDCSIDNIRWATQSEVNKHHRGSEPSPLCKKVYAYNIDYELIHTYDSATQAAEDLDVDPSSIIGCCIDNGKKFENWAKVKNLIMSYTEIDFTIPPPSITITAYDKTYIYQYTIGGEFIEKYNTKEFKSQEHEGFRVNNVLRTCTRNENKTKKFSKTGSPVEFIFTYSPLEELKKRPKLTKVSRSRPIYQYDANTLELIERYPDNKKQRVEKAIGKIGISAVCRYNDQQTDPKKFKLFGNPVQYVLRYKPL